MKMIDLLPQANKVSSALADLVAVVKEENSRIKFRDKVLPTQPFFSKYYNEQKSYQSVIADCVTSYSAVGTPWIDLIDVPVTEELSSAPLMLGLLEMMAKWADADAILEIGTCVGHTAIHLAMVTDARITTIEVGNQFAHIARENVATNRLIDRINVIHGDATNILPALETKFGLIFIDGGKENYPQYAEMSERLLTPRGVIMIDDVFYQGEVFNRQPTSAKANGCREVMERYRHHAVFNRLLLPIGDGVLIIWRK